MFYFVAAAGAAVLAVISHSDLSAVLLGLGALGFLAFGINAVRNERRV